VNPYRDIDSRKYSIEDIDDVRDKIKELIDLQYTNPDLTREYEIKILQNTLKWLNRAKWIHENPQRLRELEEANKPKESNPSILNRVLKFIKPTKYASELETIAHIFMNNCIIKRP
jgi:hypothetical protein